MVLTVPPCARDSLAVFARNYEEYLKHASNPAAKGSYIVLFATGAGSWSPSVQDGGVSLAITNFTAKPVSVTIGDQKASVYYAGSAPYEPWAMLQLTVQIPSGTPSGPQPLVLQIGQNDNSHQRLTVAVQ
jgi:uncharacterized protein (TIGR03437 family)